MEYNKIDISGFEVNHGFYRTIELILTVKSFDLQAIRKRYIESLKNKSGKAGSVERRKVSTGGIVKCIIEGGKVTHEEVLLELKEPRGICVQDDLLAIAAENTVYIISDNGVRSLTDPWFSYIHTVDIHNGMLLVTSSGFDSIFWYDLKTLKKTGEWFAWENGFNMAFDPETDQEIQLTRSAKEADQLRTDGKRFMLIDDPASQSLPTAKRAAFINSVVFDRSDPGHLLATFFHEGAVFKIEMNNGNSEKVVDGLKTPHGGNNFEGGYMATSTSSGDVVLVNKNTETRYQFQGLPGKPEVLLDKEWLQNSIEIEGIIITIDSNRTSFVLIDTLEQKISIAPYNDNWAVQDLQLAFGLKDGVVEKLRSIS